MRNKSVVAAIVTLLVLGASPAMAVPSGDVSVEPVVSS
jgi:hypothetical protein